MTGRRVRVGIDTGGTFTDVVAVDEDSGQIVSTKTPSTPTEPAAGFLTGLRRVLALLELPAESVTSVSHGTTVATNLLLEDRIGGLGLITTEGYEFVLEIARQSVPDGYGNSYFWVKPPRLVPVDLVRAVGGRLDPTGAEVRPFDEVAALAAARFFRDREIRAIGVCFLHSYANPEHELRMREVLRREHPAAAVSLSFEVLREYREYERSVTTLVDAAVKPRVREYVAEVGRRLAELAPAAPFSIMKSNGGVLSAEEVVHQPITTVLSGPAAGALGAALLARQAGHAEVITLDGGGTSTDVSVVLDGEPTVTTEGSVGRYPSRIPMVEVVTVGAGGGSIAWISPDRALKVGPRSAGAEPGPMCYDRGGREPTVTDAHLLLGRIPAHLLGGEIRLSEPAARDGVARLAAELGLGTEQCASGILEISAWNQANAVRQLTVKRGLDVRSFVLAAFGGSGPLLACRLIDVLGLAGAVVPPEPGTTSAFGLLSVDVRNDYVQTAVARHAELDYAALASGYAVLEEQARGTLCREGFQPAEHRLLRGADLRYFGQAFEVRVPAPDGPVDPTFGEAVLGAFHDAHERLYGYCYRQDARHAVEWVNLRVTGVGPIRRPRLPEPVPASGGVERAQTGSRPVYVEGRAGGWAEGRAGGWAKAPLYARPALGPGDLVTGPAVIEEFGSTVPVLPGFCARLDQYGSLLLSRHQEATG